MEIPQGGRGPSQDPKGRLGPFEVHPPPDGHSPLVVTLPRLTFGLLLYFFTDTDTRVSFPRRGNGSRGGIRSPIKLNYY